MDFGGQGNLSLAIFFWSRYMEVKRYRSLHDRYREVHERYNKSFNYAVDSIKLVLGLQGEVSPLIISNDFISGDQWVAGFKVETEDSFPAKQVRRKTCKDTEILVPNERSTLGKFLKTQIADFSKELPNTLHSLLREDIHFEMLGYMPTEVYRNTNFWGMHYGNMAAFHPVFQYANGALYAGVPQIPEHEKWYPIPSHWKSITYLEYERAMT